jgi:TP901 family phage tail tape measure protein
MAKVRSDFELNITGTLFEELKGIGLSANQAELAIKRLSKSAIEGFNAQAGSIERVKAQLKLNEIAYNQLSEEEKKNSKVAQDLLAQRKSLLIVLEQQSKANKKLIADAREQVKNETLLITSTNRQINSIRDLREVTNALIFQRDRLNLNSIDGKKRFDELTTAINNNQIRLKDYDNQIGRNQRNVGNYATALSGLAGAFGITLGVAGLVSASKAIVTQNAILSDSLADVRKTTGLTAEEVAKLDEQLLKLDTRTSRGALLSIAEGAGRIGVAKEDLAGFVEQVDKVVVALGDNLGGTADEIATQMGRFADAFRLNEIYGASEAINRVGSVINELDNQTKGSARGISAFIQQVQGVSAVAGISYEQVAGLGAGFSGLTTDVEPAGTAISQLLIMMGKKIEKVSEIAGVTTEEFRTMFKKDAVEALLFFSEAVAGSGKDTEFMAKKLDGLGLEGQKVVQALGMMGKNQDLFRKALKISNEEMIKGTSLTDEFNVKNNNLAGNIEKLKKSFVTLIADSGVIQFLNTVTKEILNITNTIKKLNSNTNYNANLGEVRGLSKDNNSYAEYTEKELQTRKKALQKALTDEKQFNFEMLRRKEEVNAILEKQGAKKGILGYTNFDIAQASQQIIQAELKAIDDISKARIEATTQKNNELIEKKKLDKENEIKAIAELEKSSVKKDKEKTDNKTLEDRKRAEEEKTKSINDEVNKRAEIREQEFKNELENIEKVRNLNEQYFKSDEQNLIEEAEIKKKLIDENISDAEQRAIMLFKIDYELQEKLKALRGENLEDVKSISDAELEIIKEKNEQIKEINQLSFDFISGLSEALTTNALESNEEEINAINEKKDLEIAKNEETYYESLQNLNESLSAQQITQEEYNKRKLEIETEYNKKQKEIQLNSQKEINDAETKFEEEKAKRIKEVTKKLLIDTLDMMYKTWLAKATADTVMTFGLDFWKIAGVTAAWSAARAGISAFEQGGLLPNKRNVILTNDGNKSNFQEYIINGDKTKKYKNELDVINFGSDKQVDNLFNGANVSAPAQINTSGTYARGGIVTASYSDNSLLKAVQSLQATTNLNTGYIASQTSQIRDLNNKMALASGKDVALIVKSGNQKLNTVR